MENSRKEILDKIRKNKPEASPLPDIPDFPLPEENLVDQFSQTLVKVGGRVITAKNPGEVAASLKEKFPEAQQIWTSDKNLLPGNINIHEQTDPHELQDLDLAVIQGQLGVAENGAVWIPEQQLPQRVAAFITLHLVILLNKEHITGNMHQAYQKLGSHLPGFGVFISGPSKTADIEQSLVVGAQGPKSLTVYLL